MNPDFEYGEFQIPREKKTHIESELFEVLRLAVFAGRFAELPVVKPHSVRGAIGELKCAKAAAIRNNKLYAATYGMLNSEFLFSSKVGQTDRSKSPWNTGRATCEFVSTLLVGIALILSAPNAFAQAARTTDDGVYSEAQAGRGKAAYQQHCAVCHGGALQGGEESPALSGNHFNARWGGAPLNTLFNFIDTQMPLGRPGELGSKANADIVAYILSFNKFPAGQADLPSDARSLNVIAVRKRQAR